MSQSSSNTSNGLSPEEIKAIEAKDRLRSKVYREALQWSVVKSVRRNVPSLTKVARKVVREVQRLDALEELAMQVYEEVDTEVVFRLLDKAAYRAKWNIYSEFDELVHEELDRIAGRLFKRDLLREIAIDIVKDRFPALEKQAQLYVNCLQAPESLNKIVVQLSDTYDETAMSHILSIEEDIQRQRKLLIELVTNRFPGLIDYATRQIEQINDLDHLYYFKRAFERDLNEETFSSILNALTPSQSKV
jgi:hypothetical protein